MTAVVLALLQLALPPPRGFVNDFAGVLAPGAVARLDSVIAGLRARSDAEIAVVTLRDLGGRPAADVALRIGREWGVGARGEAGDPRRNLGVVILLKPLENGRPGTGELFIATGRGAEGVLPDARVGRIRDAMIPYLVREDYAAGLALGVDSVAAALAEAESGAPTSRTAVPRPPPAVWIIGLILVVFILIQIARAARRDDAWRGGRRRRFVWIGGRGGWGGWGGRGGGGFGGGFGGFGGGGGFSGGGAGGRF